MITKPKKITKKLAKNFSFKPIHMEFFKKCVSGRAGSYFMQKRVEESTEFQEFLKEREKDNES
jgi:hypothetical protein